uniref:G_PROTEIN_RECEP_F1_2 domain-containing protein n=1 Tax=Globodera pallida TaxID=36090 RepID=A0A183CN47_GLOPA
MFFQIFVWGMAFVVCSPPWFVNEWRISFQTKVPLLVTADVSALARLSLPLNKMPLLSSTVRRGHREQTTTALLLEDGAYQCAYPMSVSYRIYSASVSFYIPLVVMLFVYFKIFRVASERERLIREGMGTCRLSRRVEKTQLKGRKRSATTNYTRRSNAPRIHEVIQNIASPTLTACGGEQGQKVRFIICWLPFFVVYVLEVSPVLKKWDVIGKKGFQLLSEFFLWLGYSNSVLNPLIYTMYNSDFRRCFRDLLGMGCMNQHRRTMSVKKLHQQSNLF